MEVTRLETSEALDCQSGAGPKPWGIRSHGSLSRGELGLLLLARLLSRLGVWALLCLGW